MRSDLRASLVHSPHPLLPAADRRLVFEPPRDRETLAEYLPRVGIDLEQPLRLTVDHAFVPREMWRHTRVKPGAVIHVQAVAQGGDGSNPLQAVAMIALVVASVATGQVYGASFATAIGASTPVGTALLQAGVMAVGSLAVNAIFPPPAPRFADTQGPKSSPTYAISNTGNRARPYEPLPLVLGTHRMYPDLATKTYSEYVNGDQWVYLTLCWGLGDPQVTDLRVGETPVADLGADVRYQQVQHGVPTDWPMQVDTEPGGELTVAGGALVRTLQPDSNQLAVDLATQAWNPASNTPLAVVYQVEYRPVGSLTWLPFVVQPTSSTHYWSAGYYQDQLWTWQDPNDIGRFINYNVQVWIQTDYRPSATDGRNPAQPPTAAPPAGSTWRWRANNEQHPVQAYSMGYTSAPDTYPLIGVHADPQTPLPSTNVSQITIEGRSIEPYYHTLRRSVPTGQYEVRVQRVTPDNTNTTVLQNSAVVQFKSFQPDVRSYSGQTFGLVAIRAGERIQGSLDQINGLVTQRQVWQKIAGTYQLAPSFNPAWQFLTLLGGYVDAAGRVIAGAGLAQSRIDYPAIEAWAAWCDSQNLRCAAVFDQQISVSDALDRICRVGRASRTWHTGKLGVVWDAEDQPVVAAFTPENMLPGSFAIAYPSQALADEVEVTYTDPVTWKPQSLRVVRPGVTAPARTAREDLFGVIDRAQAAAEAQLQLAQAEYRGRRVSWETDIEGLYCVRGDVVSVSHDLTSWDACGRCLSISTSSVIVDRPVLLSSTQQYLMLVAPDGAQHIARVQSGEGETDAIVLIDSLTTGAINPPDAHDWRWLYGAKPTPGQRLKIVDATPLPDLDGWRFVAVDDPSAYYAAGRSAVTQSEVSMLSYPRQSTVWRWQRPESVVDDEPVYSSPTFVANFTVTSTGLPGGAVTYSGPVVLFSSYDWFIYCLRADTGAELWRKAAGGPFYGRVQVADIDGDGLLEVVAADQQGRIWVQRCNGDNVRNGATTRSLNNLYVREGGNSLPGDAFTPHLVATGGGANWVDLSTASWAPKSFMRTSRNGAAPVHDDVQIIDNSGNVIDTRRILDVTSTRITVATNFTTAPTAGTRFRVAPNHGSDYYYMHAGELRQESGVWYLYQTGFDHQVVKFRLSDGAVMWRVATGEDIELYPWVGDVDGDGQQEVVTISFGGLNTPTVRPNAHVICLNASTGALKWATDTPGGGSTSSMAVAQVDGTSAWSVLVGEQNGRVLKIRGTDGAIVARSTRITDEVYPGVDSRPLVISSDAGAKRIFVAPDSGHLTMLDANLNTLWQIRLDAVFNSSPILVDVNYDGVPEILAADMTGAVHVLSLAGAHLGVLFVKGAVEGTPCVADIVPTDGRVEVVVPSLDGSVSCIRFV